MEAGLADSRRTVRMAAALGLIGAGPGVQVPEALRAALDEAISDHTRRARFLNEDAGVQLDLGKMLFLTGRFGSAEASIRDALTLDPKIGGGRYFLGLAAIGQGRLKEGAELLRNVDRKDPHRKDAESVLAKLPAS